MTADRPNVVLVTVDSLRADHCGFVGYEKDTTPTLDAMAEEGLVFENAIAPGPSTPESMPAIFTGQHPVERPDEADCESELQARRARIRAHVAARETLAEQFRRRGYTTAAFTPNPFTSRHFGFDAGFEHFQDFTDGRTRGRIYRTVFDGFLEGSTVASLARIAMNVWQREEVFKPWDSYYDEVVEWVEGTEEPYFLWVFLMDAHNPYRAPAEHRSQSKYEQFHANVAFWRGSHETPFSETVHDRLVTAYDDSVRYSDAFLDRLRGDLDAVIAVHGDHGEAFGEHGTYGHEPYLHEENVHVPMVVDGASNASLVGGIERASITEPFSLRRLPDLLTGIADGTTEPADLAGPFALARSAAGERAAIHGDGWRCLADGTERTPSVDGAALVAPADGTERTPSVDGAAPGGRTGMAELQSPCERLLERHRTDQRERQLVSRIVDDGRWPDA